MANNFFGTKNCIELFSDFSLKPLFKLTVHIPLASTEKKNIVLHVYIQIPPTRILYKNATTWTSNYRLIET